MTIDKTLQVQVKDASMISYTKSTNQAKVMVVMKRERKWEMHHNCKITRLKSCPSLNPGGRINLKN